MIYLDAKAISKSIELLNTVGCKILNISKYYDKNDLAYFDEFFDEFKNSFERFCSDVGLLLIEFSNGHSIQIFREEEFSSLYAVCLNNINFINYCSKQEINDFQEKLSSCITNKVIKSIKIFKPNNWEGIAIDGQCDRFLQFSFMDGQTLTIIFDSKMLHFQSVEGVSNASLILENSI
jgi:hypothetical protein